MGDSYEYEQEQLLKKPAESYEAEVGAYQSFVKIACDEDSDVMELPQEKDGTVLLSTIQAQYPHAIGLKYKSSSGGLRGIRAADNVLDAPHGGWGETVYFITASAPLKRKTTEYSSNASPGKVPKSKKEPDYLGDLIVLGLPYTTTEAGLEEYFTTNCGELAFHELKYDRDTRKTRGFGFVRFKSAECAKEALNGKHFIDGRKLEIRLARRKEDPFKIFVGRLPKEATQSVVTEYFSEYGDLDDVFVPNPWRGFAFVTFASKEDGRRTLGISHSIQGSRVTVTVAEPKVQKPQGGESFQGQNSYQSNPQASNYSWRSGADRNNDRHSGTPYQQNDPYDSRTVQTPPSKDLSSELKTMLYTLLSSQK